MSKNISHLHRSIKIFDSQRERLSLQSKSHQKVLQLHLHCIATYDKNVNSSNYKTN